MTTRLLITKAYAKQIFAQYAAMAGIPTPAQYPQSTSDPGELAAAIEEMANAARQSMLRYLPDGQELSCEEQTDWLAEILRKAGWLVSVSPDRLTFTASYPETL